MSSKQQQVKMTSLLANDAVLDRCVVAFLSVPWCLRLGLFCLVWGWGCVWRRHSLL